MKHHPEQLKDEIYMGNSTIEGILKSSWRTSRSGTVALRSDGNPVNDPSEYLKPWFIEVSEVEASIEAERLTDRPRSAERIRTLQSMIDERAFFLGGGGAKLGTALPTMRRLQKGAGSGTVGQPMSVPSVP